MDTTLLQSFLAVANSQSFSLAAQRLNVTQSTVSHQIARLEDHLGKQLFIRTTRSCRLTAEGREVVEYAAKVIRIVDEMEQNFRPSLLRGTVVVGVPDDYHLFCPLTQAFKAFMESKPGVSIEVRAGLSADLQRDLHERKIDLAVIREVPAADPAESLITNKLVWIMSDSWTPPRDGVLPLAMVAGTCTYRRTAIAALNDCGLPWRCILSCTSLEGVLAVVQAGMAVSVVMDGDVRGGVVAAPDDGLFPQLPMSSLTIRFAEGEPSLMGRALARTIANVLKRKDRAVAELEHRT